MASDEGLGGFKFRLSIDFGGTNRMVMSEPHVYHEKTMKNGDLSHTYGLIMIDPPKTGMKTQNT